MRYKKSRIGLKRDERGAILVEAALGLVVLFLVTFGIMTFGSFWWTSTNLNRASYALARCAALGISQANCKTAWNLIPAGAVVAATAACGTGNTSSLVSISYTFNSIFIGWAPIPMSSSACYPNQS